MANELIVITPRLPSTELSRARDYARQSALPATLRAYQSDFAAFQAWCGARGLEALPAVPQSVAAWLAHGADEGLKPSTLGPRCAAVRFFHRRAGHEPPASAECVKATLAGIRRAVGTAPARKAPAVAELTRDMAKAAPGSLKGLRDRALLLLRFGGAFRRSELVALDVSDIEFTDDGLRVTIRKSKTDQEGRGVTITIIRGQTQWCPMKALRD